MNADDFPAYFNGVLDKYVPSESRTCIRDYWNRFNKTPEFYLDEACIKTSFGDSTRVAGVTGTFCLHIFAFRPFLYENAPESVLRTVVQHELAHCSMHCHEQLDKLINDGLFKCISASYRPPTHFEVIRERVSRICNYNQEESIVSLLNSQWGGDDAKAWEWCEHYWARIEK